MDHSKFRKLISGQIKGFAAFILRTVLFLFSLVYGLIVIIRNFLYNEQLLTINKVDPLVISIGNLTVGGTGKTPLVIWLCNYLDNKNISCAILTRGYKAQWHNQKDSYTDEPAIFEMNCPNAAIVINSDRTAGAKYAIEKFNSEVLVMDDGFQHRRLKRNMDIVAIDATNPFGYSRILPAGLLREPRSSLRRAQLAVITRSDQVEESRLQKIEEKIIKISPQLVIARSQHRPVGIKARTGENIEFSKLRGKKVFCFCGIGNPDSFFNSVKKLGAEIEGFKIFNDHHKYTERDIIEISIKAENAKSYMILTTEKDWNKINFVEVDKGPVPYAFLQIELTFTKGQEQITELIDNLLKCTILKH